MITRACVVGAGTMGSGIAQTFASKGIGASMMDLTDDLVQAGLDRIRRPLMRRVEKGKMSKEDVDAILGRIEGTTDLARAVKGSDIVIEAVVEDMDLKKRIFRELDELAAPGVILATNTSSLSVTEIASETSRPDRVVGMHFFNPAPVMRLVEVVRGSETSTETIESIKDICVALGKEPVVVEDSPGFIVNRLLIPMLNDAFNILQEGVSSAEEIDRAMRLGTNMPMGPFELADYTGIDVALFVMETLYRETGDPKYAPSTLMRRYVRAGRLGRKTGLGVYTYRK